MCPQPARTHKPALTTAVYTSFRIRRIHSYLSIQSLYSSDSETKQANSGTRISNFSQVCRTAARQTASTWLSTGLLAVLAKSIAIAMAIISGKSTAMRTAIVFQSKFCSSIAVFFAISSFCTRNNTRITTVSRK